MSKFLAFAGPLTSRLEDLIVYTDKLLKINLFSPQVSVASGVALSQEEAEKVFDWFFTSGRIFRISVEKSTSIARVAMDKIRQEKKIDHETEEKFASIDDVFFVKFVQLRRFGQSARTFGPEVFSKELAELLKAKEGRKCILIFEKERITTVLGTLFRYFSFLGIATTFVVLFISFQRGDFNTKTAQPISQDLLDR